MQTGVMEEGPSLSKQKVKLYCNKVTDILRSQMTSEQFSSLPRPFDRLKFVALFTVLGHLGVTSGEGTSLLSDAYMNVMH